MNLEEDLYNEFQKKKSINFESDFTQNDAVSFPASQAKIVPKMLGTYFVGL